LNWRVWTRQFDQRALRERVLLSVVAVVALVQLFDGLWLTPAWRQWNQARAAQREAQSALDALDASATAVRARAGGEQQQLMAELQQLRARHPSDADPGAPAPEDQGTRPAGKRALVSARDMLPLLEQLLRSHAGLKVRSFQSLGNTPLGRSAIPSGLAPATAGASAPAKSAGPGASANAAASPSATIYRHGVELTLEGSYADLVAYLQAVEGLPQRLLWGSLQLKVEEHPRVTMTLRLYTLSLDSRWVEL
jgi:MSHA biogenesis protein MshJ